MTVMFRKGNLLNMIPSQSAIIKKSKNKTSIDFLLGTSYVPGIQKRIKPHLALKELTSEQGTLRYIHSRMAFCEPCSGARIPEENLSPSHPRAQREDP